MTERRADVECSCEITFRKDPIRTNELHFSMIRNFGLDKITQQNSYLVLFHEGHRTEEKEYRIGNIYASSVKYKRFNNCLK